MRARIEASETQEQQALIQWFALESRYLGVDERLLFAIPNGGLRSKVTGARMKKEGVRAGVPDLFLAVPRGEYAGLFIEMKTATGRVQESQKQMMQLLSGRGYKCDVARGFEEGREKIVRYLCAEEEKS